MYLSGGLSPNHAEGSGYPELGYMLTFPKANRGDRTGRPFAFDNGCYANPQAYDDDRYLAWLDARHRERCLFATAPDVVGDWRATLERSAPMMRRIRALGYPVAFIAQDDIAPDVIPWDEFDVLFIGGSTDWKLSEAAYALPAFAHTLGKATHLGRVNSSPRFRAARAAGYDSADGTMLAYGRTVNWHRVKAWIDDARRQPPLFTLECAA